MKSYGIANQNSIQDKEEGILEELKLNGFAILPSFLSDDVCEHYIDRLEAVYKVQEEQFGKENLVAIQELNMCRMPFLDDPEFLKLACDEWVVGLFERFINGKMTLHLQNGIINRPGKVHHQTSWHRDLPYQNYTVSEPIGLNAFYCLTEFTSGNGGTVLLPNSHKIEQFPSNEFIEKHKVQLNVPKGTLVLFDSFLYHRAGTNRSDQVRYGLNHLYVRPLLKQQIDIPGCLTYEDQLSAREKEILGYNFKVPTSVLDFRNTRKNKING